MRTVRRQFAVEQSGRGPLCVVQMVRITGIVAQRLQSEIDGEENDYPQDDGGKQTRAALASML